MEKTAKPETIKADVQYFDIGELKKKNHTSDPVHSGTCAAKGWGPGKQVTEEEYSAAVKKFCTAPIGGR